MNDLLVKIGADASEFNLTLESLVGKVSSWVGAIDPIAGLAVTAVGGIALAAVAAEDIFESSFNTIIGKTGAEGAQLDDLKTSFENVFTSVPVDAGNAAEAIGNISVKLGLTGQALTDFTIQAANLSRVTGEDMTSQNEAVTKSLVNWGVAQDDLGTKQDLFLKVSQASGETVTSLAQSMVEVGTRARLMGADFDSTAILVGGLAKQGIDAGDVFQGLTRAIAKTGDSKLTIDDLVFSVDKATKSLGDDGGLAAATELFGARSGPKMFELMKEGKLDVDNFAKSISDSSTTVNKLAGDTETFGTKLTLLKNNLMELLKPLGSFIDDVGKGMLNILNLLIASLNGNTEAVAKLQTQLGIVLPAQQAAKAAADNLKFSQDESNASLKALGESLKGYSTGLDTSNIQLGKNKTAHTDAIGEIAAHKLITDALAAATGLLAKADSDHADFLKSTYIPAVLDVSTADANLSAAKTAFAEADKAEQATRDALATAQKNKTGDIIAIEAALAIQEKTTADAHIAYTDAVKEQNTAKGNLQTVTKDLQSAEDAIAQSNRASYIPALVDHTTALANIDTAERNRVLAIQAVQAAEEALRAVQPQPGSPGDPVAIKVAEDNLIETKKNLVTATVARMQAVKDEKESLALLVAVQKEIDATDKLLLQNKRDLYPATQDITKATGDYMAALQAAKVADDNLKDSVQNLINVRASGPTGQQLTDALNQEKAAKDASRVSTDNLATSTAVLTTNFKLNQDTLDLLKQHTKDYTQADVDAQVAMDNLGIKSAAVLDQMATKAEASYTKIAQDSKSSDQEILLAHTDALTARITAEAAAGTTISAGQQLELAKMKQQEADYQEESVTKWATLYTTIDGDVKTFAHSAITTLITGQGSFGDAFMKLMDDIAVSVVETFLKKATDAIASFIAGAITDLLSGKGLGGVLDSLKNIGSASISAFTSASSGGGGGEGIPGVGGMPGIDTGAGGGAASAASGAVSGVMGIVGAVGAVVGAISSIIGNFQTATTNDHLFHIMNDTARMEIYIGGYGDECIFGKTKGIWQYAVEQKAFNFDVLHPDLVNLQVFGQLSNNYLSNIEDSAAALVLALKVPPIYNITTNVTLDGNSIAAAVETRIEADVRLALA